MTRSGRIAKLVESVLDGFEHKNLLKRLAFSNWFTEVWHERPRGPSLQDSPDWFAIRLPSCLPELLRGRPSPPEIRSMHSDIGSGGYNLHQTSLRTANRCVRCIGHLTQQRSEGLRLANKQTVID